MRAKKRNNFTLSDEAQKIVDAIPAYKKSKFVSESVVITAKIIKSGVPVPNYSKGGT